MATLLKGDCLKLMATLPDRSVSCFICDLPYGQLQSPHGVIPLGHKQRCPQDAGCDWDVKIDLVEFWKQVRRLAKDAHTPVLMFCNTKFGYELINSNPKWFRYDLVWYKGHGVSFLLANKMPMKSHEMIYVFSKEGAYYNRIDVSGEFRAVDHSAKKPTKSKAYNFVYSGEVKPAGNTKADSRCPLSMIHIDGLKVRGGHPTEKPLELYEWLLSRYCPKNGTVLDPTAGSFNSILVARKLGFKAIGIEMDTNFYWKAVAKFA